MTFLCEIGGESKREQESKMHSIQGHECGPTRARRDWALYVQTHARAGPSVIHLLDAKTVGPAVSCGRDLRRSHWPTHA